MNKWQHFTAWAESHREIWLDCVRIYLGLGLFARGLLLMSNTSAPFIVNLMQRTDVPWVVSGAALHYVVLAHFVGGAMLTIGFLTRFAALAQIPILGVAVFVVHRQDGLFAMGQNLEFSALVLFLLVIFLINGAGRLSLDHACFHREQHPEPAHTAPQH